MSRGNPSVVHEENNSRFGVLVTYVTEFPG